MSNLAFGLYIAFICSWFLHLPTRIPALGVIRADLVLVCIIFVLGFIGSAGEEQAPSEGRTRKILWLLVLYAAVTIPLVEWPGSVLKIGFPQFFKAFVFFYFTVTLVNSPQRLTYLLVVFVSCQMLRVIEPLYLHVTEGYWGSAAYMSDEQSMFRLSGAPSDVVNPNGFAFVILTIIPFLHFLTRGRFLGRVVYLGSLPLLLYALVLTGSRSGLIGLAGIVLMVWAKSSHKLAMIAVVVIGFSVAAPLMSADLSDRYRSIFSGDTRNAVTVQERFDGMRSDFQVAMRRPLFGHGLGTSKEANANFSTSYLKAHNLYIETAQELGFIGLTIFVVFVASVLFGLRRASRVLRAANSPSPMLTGLVAALQVWIGMNILFSFASYGLSSYDWYFAAGLSEVVRRLLQPGAAAAVVPVKRFPAVRPAFWPQASSL